MQQKGSFEDELARRREARRQGSAPPQWDEGGHESEDEPVQLGWKDTFALIIAAYQVLFPMLLIMGGALFVAYLVFKWVFS